VNYIISHWAAGPCSAWTGAGCKAYYNWTYQSKNNNYFFHNDFLG